MVMVRDPDALVEAVIAATPAPLEPKVSIGSRIRRQFNIDTWRRRLSARAVRWSLAFIAVVVLLVFAVFATSTLGMIMVLGGMATLVLAALAVADDHATYQYLPPLLTEKALVAGGFVLVGIGGVLILFL